MKKYEIPNLEVVEFAIEDVITTSDPNLGENEGDIF